MKTKIIKLIILAIICVLFTGCTNNKYQKDESYKTDIIGTYNIQGFNSETNDLILQYQYKFTTNEFEYYGLLSNTECNQRGDFIIEYINDEISKINFNIKNTEIKPNENSASVNSVKMSSQIYKYKNMLGYIYEANDIPKSKTFDYIIYDNDEKISGLVFTQDGYTHSCSNVTNCQCDYANNMQYIRKDNIIYWYSNGLSNKDYWAIEFYVTDIGLFQPLVYKIKE